MDQYLIQHCPNTDDPFIKTIDTCVVVRNKLLGDLAILKLYQNERNRLQALNQHKAINTQSNKQTTTPKGGGFDRRS